ncbi:MAG: glycogen/starch synthase [Planctomycetota bacterium]|nr:glycogen/starch synthase [Planctomycetota bacterium]
MADQTGSSSTVSSSASPSDLAIGRDPLSRPSNIVELCAEISTEVCNQVGGIYQVIRSKAPSMVQRWGDRYCVIGPYVPAQAELEFDAAPPSGKFKALVDRLLADGLRVHHGHWLISGRPRALLLEHELPAHKLDEAKFVLWERHAIATPAGDWAVDMSVSFGRAVALLLRRAAELWPWDVTQGSPRILAHFHEWLAGLAIPDLRRDKLPIATVFTTHATLLGRYIASNEENFYDTLRSRDDAAEAQRYNVKAHHSIERACAHGAHAFTTVSSITAEECSALLGRACDLVLPNGINVERYDVMHEFQTMHARFKEQIHRFVMGYFFPSYTFDLDRTLYVFTSGRFEPRNKGFDVCLEAMARLNAQLKDFGIPMTVVFFIVTKRHTRSIHPDVLHSRGVLNELREVCRQIMEQVGDELFPRAAKGEKVNIDEIVDPYWAMRYRRTQHALKRQNLPPVITHVLDDDSKDPVLTQIRQLQLFNRPEDPVKVVYHPDFISPTSPLWGMDYDQFVRGCHVGVFPSAYEPWGYTPLECIAMGVPSITSDLAGFGRYVAERYPDHDAWGLHVLRRRGRGFHDSAAELARWLLAFCRLERRGRIDMRNEVERHATEFDWSRLVRAYHQAHDLAVERAKV